MKIKRRHVKMARTARRICLNSDGGPQWVDKLWPDILRWHRAAKGRRP